MGVTKQRCSFLSSVLGRREAGLPSPPTSSALRHPDSMHSGRQSCKRPRLPVIFFSFPLKGARRHCGLHTLQELIPSWKQLHCSWRMPSVDTAVSSTSHSVELRGAANCDVFQRKQHGNCFQNPSTRMRCWGPARWCPQCPCCLPQLSTQSLPTTPTP